MDNLPAADRTYESLSVGEEAAFTRTIRQADVDAFAALTGDRSPLHMDDAYAATTPLGRRVVHGMLVASFFSTLVGMFLPGRRALFLGQDVKFARPVFVDDTLVFSARVRQKVDAVRMIELEVTAADGSGDVRVRGRAQVKVLP